MTSGGSQESVVRALARLQAIVWMQADRRGDGDARFAGLPYHPRRILPWYLQWAAIEGRDEVRAYGLPEPYEPAIVMYERGGDFHVENGMYRFHAASFPLGTLASHLGRPPLARLDEETLAAADEAWRRELAERR
jgi:hypothetical protein